LRPLRNTRTRIIRGRSTDRRPWATRPQMRFGDSVSLRTLRSRGMARSRPRRRLPAGRARRRGDRGASHPKAKFSAPRGVRRVAGLARRVAEGIAPGDPAPALGTADRDPARARPGGQGQGLLRGRGAPRWQPDGAGRRRWLPPAIPSPDPELRGDQQPGQLQPVRVSGQFRRIRWATSDPITSGDGEPGLRRLRQDGQPAARTVDTGTLWSGFPSKTAPTPPATRSSCTTSSRTAGSSASSPREDRPTSTAWPSRRRATPPALLPLCLRYSARSGVARRNLLPRLSQVRRVDPLVHL